MNENAVRGIEQQLRALEILRANATESEHGFYDSAEEELRGYLDALAAPPAPVTAERLRTRLERIVRTLDRLRRQLDDPDLGEYWHAWARDEVALVEAARENAEQQWRELASNEPFELPPLDEAEQTRALTIEDAANKVEELEMLRGLHVSWMEREGGDAGAEALADIDERLARARDVLDRARVT